LTYHTKGGLSFYEALDLPFAMKQIIIDEINKINKVDK